MADTLSADIWALIIAHVPHKDRLKNAALVSVKLSKAAAAATPDVQVLIRGRRRGADALAEGVDSYLQHHGSFITSLHVDYDEFIWKVPQLPCPNLVRFEVRGRSDGWSGSATCAGPIVALPDVFDSCCTSLTQLKLRECIVTPAGGLSKLSLLVNLVDVELQQVFHPREARYDVLCCEFLPTLKHLTRLDVSYVDVQDLHHVSAISSLCALKIGASEESPGRLAPDISPGFVLPSTLKDLSVSCDVVLDPWVLPTQLTRLEVGTSDIEGHGEVSNGAALLAAVAQLSELAVLKIEHLEHAVQWPTSLAAYTAVTASSKLQSLSIQWCGWRYNVWATVFPDGSRQKLPYLTRLEAVDRLSWFDSTVSNMVKCCPALRNLQLPVYSPAVADLSRLTDLTELGLHINCEEGDSEVQASVHSVAAFTNLRSLTLEFKRPYPEDSDDELDEIERVLLKPLVALTQLEELDVQDGPGTLNNKRDPTPVWQQLERWCAQEIPPRQKPLTKAQLAQLTPAQLEEYAAQQAAAMQRMTDLLHQMQEHEKSHDEALKARRDQLVSQHSQQQQQQQQPPSKQEPAQEPAQEPQPEQDT